MNHDVLACIAVLCSSALPAQAQSRDATNTLARALSTFQASDADKDGKISARELEANALKIEPRVFAATDYDKDGFWSRDEFIIYYKQLLKANRQSAAADLDQEVARIQAVRRAQETERAARVAEEARKAGLAKQAPASDAGSKEAARAVPPVKTGETAVDVDARLQRALDELAKKAEARGATREDFNAVRDLYTARAKAAQAGTGTPPATDPASVDVEARLQRAIDDLEKKALEGQWSREEFTAMRDMMNSRARAAVTSPGGEKPAADPATSKESVAARFESALADLEKKAAARGATREDFQRVKELLVARAREAWNAAEPKGDAAAEQAYAARIEQLYKSIETSAAEGPVSSEPFTHLRKAVNDPAGTAAAAAKGPADQRRQDASKPAPVTDAVRKAGTAGEVSGARAAPKDGAKPQAPSQGRVKDPGTEKPATPPPGTPPQKPAGPAKEREKPPTDPPHVR